MSRLTQRLIYTASYLIGVASSFFLFVNWSWNQTNICIFLVTHLICYEIGFHICLSMTSRVDKIKIVPVKFSVEQSFYHDYDKWR